MAYCPMVDHHINKSIGESAKCKMVQNDVSRKTPYV